MRIMLITSECERLRLSKLQDAYGEYIAGRLTKAEWDTYPRETWLDCTGKSIKPFVVCDNRDGECFIEAFSSLDGAMLYASGVYPTAVDANKWDYEGAANKEDLAKNLDVVAVEREECLYKAAYEAAFSS